MVSHTNAEFCYFCKKTGSNTAVHLECLLEVVDFQKDAALNSLSSFGINPSLIPHLTHVFGDLGVGASDYPLYFVATHFDSTKVEVVAENLMGLSEYQEYLNSL